MRGIFRRILIFCYPQNFWHRYPQLMRTALFLVNIEYRERHLSHLFIHASCFKASCNAFNEKLDELSMKFASRIIFGSSKWLAINCRAIGNRSCDNRIGIVTAGKPENQGQSCFSIKFSITAERLAEDSRIR